MIKILQKFLQEPLIVFLLLGFLLYLYYASVTQDDTTTDTSIHISLSASEIQGLKREYTKEYKKSMSEEELALYVQNAYRQKVLLEESTRLDLHKNDTTIATRLIEKMEFILLGSVEYQEPSEEELHAYYMKNIGEYSEVKKLSFVHIYFERSPNNMDALYTMNLYNKLSTHGAENLGDSFEGANSYENISYEVTQEKFGKYFASKVFGLRKGVWYKGIHSKYGQHLVYVSAKVSDKVYSFDEVEDRVYRDYLAQAKEETIASAYKSILQNYTLGLDK